MEAACNFSKSNTPQWAFFTFFILYNWYHNAQCIANVNHRVGRAEGACHKKPIMMRKGDPKKYLRT